MLDLNDSSQLLRLLAEPTRLRLLLLLGHEPLSVAELTSVTQLTQSRISSHLARLREAGLVVDGGLGGGNRYTVDATRWPRDLRPLWGLLSERIDDAQLAQDRERATEIVRRRNRARRLGRIGGRPYGTPVFTGPNLGSGQPLDDRAARPRQRPGCRFR